MVIAADTHPNTWLNLPPARGAILSNIPSPEDYEDVFSALDRCDGVPTHVPPFEPVDEASHGTLPTPPITHWIWMGSSFENKEHQNNITETCKMLRGHTKIMWTDQVTYSESMIDFCKSNDIKIVLIDDVFGEGGLPMGCADHFEISRTDFPPNYGKSSDILRYNLLNLFGGVYFDSDIYLEQSKWKYTKLLSNFSHEKLVVTDQTNDFIASPPKNPLLMTFLEKTIPDRAAKNRSELWSIFESSRFKSWLDWTIFQTTYVTGPIALLDDVRYDADKTHHEILENHRTLMTQTDTNYSWKAKPVKEKLSEPLVDRLARSILRDIRFDPTKLPIKRYACAFPDPYMILRTTQGVMKAKPSLFANLTTDPLEEFSKIPQLYSHHIAEAFKTLSVEDQVEWTHRHDGLTPAQQHEILKETQTLDQILEPGDDSSLFILLRLEMFHNKSDYIKTALKRKILSGAYPPRGISFRQQAELLDGSPEATRELHEAILKDMFNQEQLQLYRKLVRFRATGVKYQGTVGTHNTAVNQLIITIRDYYEPDRLASENGCCSHELAAITILSTLRYPVPMPNSNTRDLVDELFGEIPKPVEEVPDYVDLLFNEAFQPKTEEEWRKWRSDVAHYER